MDINPLLKAAQSGDLLRAANARLVVTLTPTPGTDLCPTLANQLLGLPVCDRCCG